MKNSLIVLLVLLVSVIFVGSAVSQSNYDWEMVCESGEIETTLLEGNSILVKCLSEKTPTPEPRSGILVDHTSIGLFEQIPPEYKELAENIPMMFSDRSVGVNISEGLDCLASSSWETSPSYCRKDYTDSSQTTIKTYTSYVSAPDLIKFTGGYDRSNWTYADCQGSWSYMTNYFINTLAPQFINYKDVLSCQYSYLNVSGNTGIIDPNTGYFVSSSNYDIYDLEEYLNQYPDKTFIYWTTSLARIIGTYESTRFNELMREYAIKNNKTLFDMADIISHDRYGNECLDSTGRYPIICRDYTSEINGGHLGSVSGGKIIMAKSFWVLMAQLAGWRP